MSNTITFGLDSSIEQAQLQMEVERLWTGDEAVVFPGETGRESLGCVLYWYFGSKEEKRAGREIARHLIARSDNQQIYYYRCEETAEWAEDSGLTLGVEQIFEPDYEPNFFQREHYYYTVVERAPDASGEAATGESELG